MIHLTTAPTLALATAMMVGGAVLGLTYFACLKWTTDLFAAEGRWARLALLTLARLVAVVIAFALAARLGAIPLLAAFAGFLVARSIALRQGRRAA
jgi:F1F0 ATPase subunit 2